MKIKDLMEGIKMSQREFQKIVGYNRTTMYFHDTNGGILNDGQLEDINGKVKEYAMKEGSRLIEFAERLRLYEKEI